MVRNKRSHQNDRFSAGHQPGESAILSTRSYSRRTGLLFLTLLFYYLAAFLHNPCWSQTAANSNPGHSKEFSKQEITGQQLSSEDISRSLLEFLVKKIGQEKINMFEPLAKPFLNSEAFDLYLLNFWLKGKSLEALLLISFKLRETPDDPGLLNSASAFLCSINQLRLAYVFLEQAHRLDPTNPSTLNNLGVASCRLGQVKEARQFFGKTLELDSFHPEAGHSLFLLDSQANAARKNRNLLINSLRGAFRETTAQKIEDFPLPLSAQQEVFLTLPPLPTSFLQYKELTSYYQEAFLKMEEKESQLQKKLDTLTFSGLKRIESNSANQSTFSLTSILAYSRLLGLEGRFGRLEKETETPVDIELEQLISALIKKLETLDRDYLQEEKACLKLPRAERPECLKKARENYCQRYSEQLEYYYQRYRNSLENYFKNAEPELNTFLTGCYFWVRYLPEDQKLRKRAELELKAWKIYERLWEKSFQLLSRLGQPAFPECFPPSSLKPESAPEPEIFLSDPFSEINLNYSSKSFSFFLSGDRIIINDSLPEFDFPSEESFCSATIHIYSPESEGARAVYVVVDDERKVNDLGELGPWAFFGLSSSSRWRIFISLSLPVPGK
jgi:hypothetical protein